MTLSQGSWCVRVDSPARVENSVKNVDGPGTAGEQESDPWLETDVSGTRQSEGPHHSYGRRIETGQMPEFNGPCNELSRRHGIFRLAGQL